ncbi:MAG: flippase-like domain-containing protein [Methanomicrobiales archaeon]|nr:flippase-like domain-containing protein [Methanomicrobiales archaeon]
MYRRVSILILSCVVAGAILAYMLLGIWDRLLETLARADPRYLVLAVAICGAGWWMRGWRYRYILETLEVEVSLAFSTACILVSQTANLAVPARLGDLIRIFILRHERETPYEIGLSSLVVERVFDVMMVAVLGLFSLPFVLGAPPWIYPLVVLPLLLGGIFFLVLMMTGKLTARHRVFAFLLRMMEGMRRASLSVRSVTVLGISSILIWMMDVLACAAVVLMFGQEVPFSVIILAIVVGNLVKAIPLTPGGVGTYEAAVAVTLLLAGMSQEAATLIAILDHLIKNAVTLAGGILSIAFLGSWVVAIMKKAFRGGGGGEGNGGTT